MRFQNPFYDRLSLRRMRHIRYWTLVGVLIAIVVLERDLIVTTVAILVSCVLWLVLHWLEGREVDGEQGHSD